MLELSYDLGLDKVCFIYFLPILLCSIWVLLATKNSYLFAVGEDYGTIFTY